MTKEDFIKAGFVEVDDPLFQFEKSIISSDVIKDAPKLLYGTTGVNNGFCLYTGAHFIFIDADTPKSASEWVNRIVSLEYL